MAEPKKDYLSTLAEEIEKKPASFKEEKVERVARSGPSLNPKILIGIIAAVVVIAAASYFLFFAPKIKMENFVGQPANSVGIWIRENGLQNKDVVMNPVYSMEYDKDIIVDQNKKEGTKVKKGMTLVFDVSKGADPDEKIAFPDIQNMTRDEIESWVDENKLSKVRINVVYDARVEKDFVISFDMKNVSEDDFTRGTNLTVNISKGPQPIGQVNIDDFTKKEVSEVEAWAKNKKINLEINEVYHDTLPAGKVVSQSIEAGNVLEQGDTLTINVSKGKAVTIPNLVGYSAEQLSAWTANKENNVTIVEKKVLSEKPAGSVIRQSLAAGSMVDAGELLELTISLYMPQLQTTSRQWLGQDYLQLNAWVDEKNFLGANIAAGPWDGEVCSDEYPTPGQITSYHCMDANGNELPHGCDRPLPLDAKIGYTRSTGPCTVKQPEATPEPSPVYFDNVGPDRIVDWCNQNGGCEFKYEGNSAYGVYINSDVPENEITGMNAYLKPTDKVIVKLPPKSTPEPSSAPETTADPQN